jgi:DNA-binding transcriptional regulator LsrR (DeoR family)
MSRLAELRLLAKVARMYYQRNLTQREITTRLNVHQSTVSRLLKRAEHEGIVRVSLTVPSGVHPELEETLQSTYGLREAIVVDSIDDEAQVVRDLGVAAAYYVETTLRPAEVIGISSFSAALLSMVDAMHPTTRARNARVVQILGGVGSPVAEAHATHLTRRLATLVSGTATLLPAPGVLGSAQARDIILKDRYVREATDLFEDVTLALIGIGALEPSKLLAASGNVFSPHELDMLRSQGAVGDLFLRFFDASGSPVRSPLDDRVISMNLEQLRKVDRVVGVAGGPRKITAIRGALRGGLVNVLITDRFTAERLLQPLQAEPPRADPSTCVATTASRPAVNRRGKATATRRK